jgi:hypothetical protein
VQYENRNVARRPLLRLNRLDRRSFPEGTDPHNHGREHEWNNVVDRPARIDRQSARDHRRHAARKHQAAQHASASAWYYSGKWFLSNSDGERLPVGCKYQVQFFTEPGTDHFLHIFTKENIGAEGSYIDHPALNDNPNAKFKILQNHAPEARSYYLNRFEAQASYSTAAGRWYIANINNQPIGAKTAYNIVITGGSSVGC